MSDTYSSDCISAQNLSNCENENENENENYTSAEQSNSSAEESDYENDSEELLVIEENAKSLNEKLIERVRSLQNTMCQLKCQLQDEREKWKKEVEELSKLPNNNGSNTNLDIYEPEEINESIISADIDQDIFGNMETIKEYTISEYEQKLARYQEALARAQQEKRATLKRQIAISNYKRRLLEVENMCNLELLRVKQNVQFLQPLQMIASEWNKDKEVQDHGDDGTSLSTLKEIEDSKDRGDIIKCKEVKPIENIGNKLFSDMSEMFSKIPSYNSNLISTPSYWQSEDEAIAIRNSSSSVWYPM